MDLQIGQQVTFRDKDENGTRYQHTGEIVEVDSKKISFVIPDEGGGELLLTVPVEEANKFSPTKKRVKVDASGWSEYFGNVMERAGRVRKSKTGSKKDAVVNLVREHNDLTRKEQIEMCVEQLGISKGCASTYVSQARKMV